jgi:hypothetical protein
MMMRLIVLVWMPLLICGCAGGSGIRIGMTGSPGVVSVRGVDGRGLESFEKLEQEKRAEVVKVWVAEAESGMPALLGDVERRGEEIVFVPRYPFRAGVKYRARVDPGVLGQNHAAIVNEFEIPAPPQKPVTRVAAIYPSADELPENLLKFYIHFSGPMSRGEAYRRVKLLDEAGQVVPWPFLELSEELWNAEMTRFTLFFEPGRIKQGLVPRLEMGPALVSGKSYVLVVDGAWKDGENRPLVEGAGKSFRVGPADRMQPEPARWRIKPPRDGSRGELLIEFDEPLDHAMLQRVITVRDGGGREVAGKVKIDEGEKRWIFEPGDAWKAGRHVVAVETILEDRAGNSIGRAFEVEQTRATGEGAAVREIAFEVK